MHMCASVCKCKFQAAYVCVTLVSVPKKIIFPNIALSCCFCLFALRLRLGECGCIPVSLSLSHSFALYASDVGVSFSFLTTASA